MSTNALETMLSPFNEIAAQLSTQNEILTRILQTLEAQGKEITKVREESSASRRISESLKTITGYTLMAEIRATFQARQLGFLETLDVIRNEELSFARFGDGELRNMFRPEFSIYFQKNSAKLASDLRAAMSAEGAPNLLVGLPNIFADLHWTTVFHEVWDQMKPVIEGLPRFGNGHVSRPVMFQAHGAAAVEAWRNVWDGKEALIITGKGSRFDLVPALYSNLKDHRYEYSAPRDAYDDLDRVEELALGAQEKLVIISLGPAGSILAHRLAKAGKQALDIGHLASSYSHVIKGGAFPEKTAMIRS